MKVENKDTYFVFQFNDLKQVFICFMVFVFLGNTYQIFAQKSLTSTQLLAGSSVTESSQLLQNNLEFLKESNQGMPLVNKMEARTETDEWDIIRQEYLFRMSFNSKNAREAQNKITDNNINLYELKSQIVEEAKLIERYEGIVDWYYTQTELNYLEEEKIVQKDKKTVYQKMLANSLVMNVDDLLKVEKEIQDIDRRVLQLDLKKEYILKALVPEMEVSEGLALDVRNWISLKTMAFVLTEVKDKPTSNLAQAIQSAKIDTETLAFDMEKAENKQVLDFVQIKYSGRDKLAFQKELSIGVGFNIPTKSSARVKLNEAKLDIFDEEYKAQLLKEKFEKRISNYYNRFNSLMREYDLIEQQISQSDLKETLKNYSNTGTVHPLTLLRITASLQKNKQTLQNIEKDACLIFLEILLDKGLLSAEPKINYLSDSLNPF